MRILPKFFIPLALVAVTAMPVQAQNMPDHKAGDEKQQVQLFDAQKAEIGVVTLQDAPGGMLVTVDVGPGPLSEGWHGFHIHETGLCTSPDFKSAGGHASAEGQAHGLLDEEISHAGDLPNLWINADGSGKAAYFASADLKPLLSDADGSAVMIHQGADDYKTDPAGDAGHRVACGVITPPPQ